MPIESLERMAEKYGGMYHDLVRMKNLAIRANRETDKNERRRINRKLMKEEKSFYKKLEKN